MNCANCGVELTPGAKFCRNCGTPAPVETPEIKEVVETVNEVAEETPAVPEPVEAPVEEAPVAPAAAIAPVVPAAIVQPAPAAPAAPVAPAPNPYAAPQMQQAYTPAPTPAPAPAPYQPAPAFASPAQSYAKPALAAKRYVNYPVRIITALLAVAALVLIIVLGTGQFKDFQVEDFFKKKEFWAEEVPIILFVLFLIGNKITDAIGSLGMGGLLVSGFIGYFKDVNEDIDEVGDKMQYISGIVLFTTFSMTIIVILLFIASCVDGSVGKGISIGAFVTSLYLWIILAISVAGFFIVGFDGYRDDDQKMFDILDRIHSIVAYLVPVFASIALITEKKDKKTA